MLCGVLLYLLVYVVYGKCCINIEKIAFKWNKKTEYLISTENGKSNLQLSPEET